jgi:hypothetical protein
MQMQMQMSANVGIGLVRLSGDVGELLMTVEQEGFKSLDQSCSTRMGSSHDQDHLFSVGSSVGNPWLQLAVVDGSLPTALSRLTRHDSLPTPHPPHGTNDNPTRPRCHSQDAKGPKDLVARD